MPYGKWNDLEIPNISAVEIDWNETADEDETIGGIMRKDSIAVKRIWQVECIYLTLSQAKTLTDYWKANLFAVGEFWLHEFGAEENTVLAMISANSVQEIITPFRDKESGVWHKDGRSLFFTVKEVLPIG